MRGLEARYKDAVPICIAGMPHSGRSTVVRLLGGLGLDLGEPHGGDEPEGTPRFVELNDEILETAGVGWDSPSPPGRGWAQAPRLEPLLDRAEALCTALALSEPWGWAAPRNSLTLPFWREVFSDLRVLIACATRARLPRCSRSTGSLWTWRSAAGRRSTAPCFYSRTRASSRTSRATGTILSPSSSGSGVRSAWTARARRSPGQPQRFTRRATRPA